MATVAFVEVSLKPGGGTVRRQIAHDVQSDDTVGIMAQKLEELLKSRVYVWCDVRVTPHEAFGIIHARAALDGDPAAAFRAFVGGAHRPGPAVTGNPAAMLRELERLDAGPSGPLRMPRSVMFGYMAPGGYYVDHGVDPYGGRNAQHQSHNPPPNNPKGPKNPGKHAKKNNKKKGGDDGVQQDGGQHAPRQLGGGGGRDSPQVDARFVDGSRAFSQADNFTGLLVESFFAEEFYVTTLRDIQRAAPADQAETEAWRQGVVGKYFPELPDRGVYPLTPRYRELQARRGRFLGDSIAPTAVHSAYLVGGKPAGAPETLGGEIVVAFTSSAATAAMPAVRLRTGVLGRAAARVHDSASAAVRDIVTRAAAGPGGGRGEWIQFVFDNGDEPPVTLTVYGGGTYSVGFKFGRSAQAGRAALAAFFPRLNAALAAVSPFLPPLDDRVWRPSAFLYGARQGATGPRPYLLRATQTVDLAVSHRCGFEAVAAALADVAPVAKLINRKDRSIYMQFLRANSVRPASIVRAYMYFNKERLTPAVMASLMAEFRMDRATIEALQDAPASQFDTAPVAVLSRRSDTRYSLEVHLTSDLEYIDRLRVAVLSCLAECGRKNTAKKGVPQLKHTNDFLSGSRSSAGTVGAGKLSELYEMLYEGYDATATEDKETRPGNGEVAEPGERKLDIGSDTLQMLQYADNKLFDFKRDGFESYSRKCGKNKSSNRQPVVVSGQAAQARAAKGSHGDAVKHALRYGSDAAKKEDNLYLCPEKWCPVSGVAIMMNEKCPDPDEAPWVFGKGRFPGFLQRELHPDGLCMPCCFNKQPKPGSETHGRIRACTAAVEGADGANGADGPHGANGPRGADGADEADDAGAGKAKKHVNRASRVLKKGDVGAVPEPLGLAGGVRLGMGAGAGFAEVCAQLRSTSASELRQRLAAELRIHHFVQCDVRRFIDVSRTAPPALTPEYRRTFGLPEKLGAEDRQREGVVAAALEACRAALRDPETPMPYEVVYKLVNSGALPGPPVLVVSVDEADNASVEHLHASRLAGHDRVAVVLKWRGAFEPLGASPQGRDKEKGQQQGQARFQALWSVEHPWVRKLLRAMQKGFKPPADERVRVVSCTMMAVGAVAGGGADRRYEPFAVPVAVEPGVPHRYASASWLRGVRGAATLLEDNARDEMLFSDSKAEDARVRHLRALQGKLRLLHEAQLTIAKKGLRTETDIRSEARRLVKDGPSREYVVSHLLHPTPEATLPFVKLHEHEAFL